MTSRKQEVEMQGIGIKRHVALDVETTGLSPEKGDRVIEIGAVAVEDNHIVSEFGTLICVKQKISFEAQMVNGISNEMLVGKPEPENVLPAFWDFIADSVLVAHNAKFDLKFLRHEFGRLGFSLTNSSVCTLEMSRRRFPRLPNHRLETVAMHVLGAREDYRFHRALDDARLVARMWMEMTGK